MRSNDDSRNVVGHTDELDRIGEMTAAFERELERLILDSFAEGARIEGTWEFTSELDAIPEWTIEIARHSNGSVDGVSLLDE